MGKLLEDLFQLEFDRFVGVVVSGESSLRKCVVVKGFSEADSWEYIDVHNVS